MTGSYLREREGGKEGGRGNERERMENGKDKPRILHASLKHVWDRGDWHAGWWARGGMAV